MLWTYVLKQLSTNLVEVMFIDAGSLDVEP